jgi:hypothetical protein
LEEVTGVGDEEAVAAPVGLPVAGSATLVGRVGWWGCTVTLNLITQATGPHLLFMALRDGGPPAVLGLDAPNQGASQGSSGRWAT